MNRRPIDPPEEQPCENVEDLKKMLAETQRINKLLQADISNTTRSNATKRAQNQRLKDKAKEVHREMQQLVDQHMRVFEEKIEAEKADNDFGSTQHGISPFALKRLTSFRFEAGSEPTMYVCAELSCCVCYSQLDGSSRCKRLPGCGHTFHSQCIKEHLLVSRFCPGCGEQVKL